MVFCVYGAASNDIDPTYLQAGEELGYAIAKRGHGVVYGGGQTGMMGAVARGMSKGGGHIVGVAPRFFDIEGVLYEECTEFVWTDTMRQRKAEMERRADVFIMTPGGVGTFEEFFEILTLRQLGRHNKPIYILNTNHYYDDLNHMLAQAVEKGFMRAECQKLWETFEDVDALLDDAEFDPVVVCSQEELRHDLPKKN